MYLGFEGARVPSSEVARKGRAFEIGLIDRLAGSSDPAGTIGIQARSSLQRIPSSIYWNGLKLLRICLFPGSQTEYHRGLDRQNAAGATVRRNDVVEVDGAQHLADPVAYRRDRRKDRLLQENGYLVLRYLAEDLAKELGSVLDGILRALSARRKATSAVTIPMAAIRRRRA